MTPNDIKNQILQNIVPNNEKKITASKLQPILLELVDLSDVPEAAKYYAGNAITITPENYINVNEEALGLADLATKTELTTAITENNNNYYTKTEMSNIIDNQDVYSKEEVDNLLSTKSDTDHTHDQFYTKTEVENLLLSKADEDHDHSISDVNNLQNVLNSKAGVMHPHYMSDILDLSDGYYNKVQIDDMVSGITSIDMSAYELTGHTQSTSTITDLADYTGFTNYPTNQDVLDTFVKSYDYRADDDYNYIDTTQSGQLTIENQTGTNNSKVNIKNDGIELVQTIDGIPNTIIDMEENAIYFSVKEKNLALGTQRVQVNTIDGIVLTQEPENWYANSLVTKSMLDTAINQVSGGTGGSVDLSNYYNKTQTDAQISTAVSGVSVDLSNYYTKSETQLYTQTVAHNEVEYHKMNGGHYMYNMFDVQVQSPSDNQVLVWNSSQNKWLNSNVPSSSTPPEYSTDAKDKHTIFDSNHKNIDDAWTMNVKNHVSFKDFTIAPNGSEAYFFLFDGINNVNITDFSFMVSEFLSGYATVEVSVFDNYRGIPKNKIATLGTMYFGEAGQKTLTYLNAAITNQPSNNVWICLYVSNGSFKVKAVECAEFVGSMNNVDTTGFLNTIHLNYAPYIPDPLDLLNNYNSTFYDFMSYKPLVGIKYN